MKKFLFVLMSLLILVMVSCGDDNTIVDEPEVQQDIQECAVTYFENQILNKHLSYGEVSYNFYNGKGVVFDLYDYDDYINPYNSNKANLMSTSYINNLQNRLENDFNLSLNYNGSYTSTVLTSFSGRSGTFYIHRFGCTMYGDEVQIFTEPNHYEGYIHVKIYCNHEHKYHRLNK